MPGEHSAGGEAPRRVGRRIDVVLATGAVALCAAVVAGLAWSRPSTSGVPLSYTESGAATYSEPTAPSSIYGSSGVTTGKPVYLNAVKHLNVSYDFSATSSAPIVLNGTEQLVATVEDALGASRTLSLQPPTHFVRSAFVATGTLDLNQLSSAVASLSRSAGIDAPGAFTVALSPSVIARGTLDGHLVESSFDQPVDFTYLPSSSTGSAELTPTLSAPNSGGSNTSAGASLSVSATTPTNILVRRPVTLFRGWSVRSARVVSLAALVAALLIGALLGRRLLVAARSEDEDVRIALRHGSSLIEVDSLPSAPKIVIVEVSSFNGLLQAAKRLECPILHCRREGDAYAVVDGGTLYRYVTSSLAESTARRRNNSAQRSETEETVLGWDPSVVSVQ